MGGPLTGKYHASSRLPAGDVRGPGDHPGWDNSPTGARHRNCSPAEAPAPQPTAYSFLATSGPVMRRSSGMVAAMMPRLSAMPAPVMR
jgi:hypothetical protein